MASRCIALVCVLVAACSDRGSLSQQLFQTVPEPPGVHCPTGGVAIETGVDRNGDGALEPNELTSTTYVCSGTLPPAQLVNVVPEPPGAHCANGGQAVEIGLDSNGDHVLEDGEITSTSYVCAGSDGSQPLIRVDLEAPGAHCAAGGEAIHSGVDANGDGILEDSEITATTYVCRLPAELVNVVAEPPGTNCANGGDAVQIGLDSNANGALDPSEVSSTSYVCATSDNQQPLVRVDAEPPGVNCAAGGDAIHSGLDSNRDHVLEDSEVTATTYVCRTPAELVRLVSEPAGAHCTNGGEAVETGIDSNADGVLDANEVTSVSYVCAGSNAQQPLIRLDPEPPGASCSAGGTAVRVGVDTNADGILENGEVTATSYVCANGKQPLVRVDAEAPGANCAVGGSAIHAGLDGNGDGVLEDSEIQTTTYLCNGGNGVTPTTIDGSFTIRNSLDVAMLDGVDTITGDLEIVANGMTAVHVATVQHIGGTLRMENVPTVTEIDFPNLASVDTLIINSDSGLATLSLPKLASVSSGVIDSNPALATIDVSALAAISTALHVGLPYSGSPTPGNPALTSVAFPSLVTLAGELDIINCGVTSVSLSALVSGGNVVVTSDAQLTTLTLPAMTSGSIAATDDTALVALHLPSLLSGGVDVERDPVLPSIDAPVLQSGVVTAGSDPLMTSLALSVMTSGVVIAYDDSGLTSVDIPALQSGAIEVEMNPLLTTVSAPSLINASEIRFVHNAGLTTVSLPVMSTVSQDFAISGNALTSVSIPSLQTIGGDFLITVEPVLALVQLDNLTTVGGNFSVWNAPGMASSPAQSLSAPLLQSIGGALSLYLDNFSTISFPALTSVGNVDFRALAVTTLSIPALRTVQGDMNVYGLPTTPFTAPGLQRVGGTLSVQASSFASLSFPMLLQVSGAFIVRQNPALMTISAPALQHVAAELSFQQLVYLNDVDLSALESTGTSFSVTDAGIWTWDPMSLSIGALADAGDDFVVENTALTSISAPHLTSVRSAFRVDGNPQLPTCQAQALASQLTPPPPLVAFNNLGTCP